MAAVGPVSGVTLYAAAKFGCRGFSLAANKDLASDGIAVTCLMPDAMQTPMVTKQLDCDGGAYAFSQAEILSEETRQQIAESLHAFFREYVKDAKDKRVARWRRETGTRLGVSIRPVEQGDP